MSVEGRRGPFTNHSRAHQYLVNGTELRDGCTIIVDRDAWDAAVAITG